MQQRISLVRGDREIEVLHRLLDGDSMRALAEIFKSPLEELWERVQEAQEKESEHEYYREFHKLDFTRKKIQHQVMCRKPKHLIKKIIR